MSVLLLYALMIILAISTRVPGEYLTMGVPSAFAGGPEDRTADAAPYFCARSRRTDPSSSLHASSIFPMNKVCVVSRFPLHMMFCSNLSTLSEPSLRRWLWRYLNDPDPLILVLSARHHTDHPSDPPSPPTSSFYILACICLCLSNEFLLLCRKDLGPP